LNNPFSVLLSACWFLLANNSPVANELAIVIDDLGYSYQAGKRAIDLPGQITLAILPFAPNTRALAKYAKEKNKEVIIHLPMQAEQDEVNVSEKVVLRQHMSSIQFKVILDASSNNLSNARGISNHTGSLLTQKRVSMRKLMSLLAQGDFYFLDSKTSSQSIATKIANQFNVAHVSRDFFLDNIKTESNMEAMFKRAIKLSRKTGKATVLAHPYASSLYFLERQLADLPHDIQTVFASKLTTHYPTAPVPP